MKHILMECIETSSFRVQMIMAIANIIEIKLHIAHAKQNIRQPIKSSKGAVLTPVRSGPQR